MRNKYLAILIAVSMLFVSATFDIFALETDAVDPAAAAAETAGQEAPDNASENASETGLQPAEEGAAESSETEILIDSETTEGSLDVSEDITEPASLSLSIGAGEDPETEARLEWELSGYEPAEGDSYQCIVYQDDTAISTEPVEASALNSGEYTASGLTAGTEYKFKVELTSSNAETTTTIASAEENYTVPAPVEKPGNVKKFKALSAHKSVVLKWSEVSDADGYIIKFTTKKGGKYNKTIKIKDGDTTRYTHKVPEDKMYYYQIFAYKGTKDNLSKKGKKVSGDAIRAIHYKVTFKTTRTLQEHKNGGRKANGSYKVTIKGGKTIECYGFYDGRYIFNYKCKDGKTRVFYVTRISIRNPKVSQVNNKRVYTEEEAENYVNSLKIGSNTPYLIWGSLYSQHMYVFKGSKGKWKLHKGPWVISSGKASMPTSTGLTRIKQKVRSEHGIPFWNVCNFFSIHGKLSKWTLGLPASGACMRNYTENAQWVYNTCKVGTAVYVY